jgi:hypothetical protein
MTFFLDPFSIPWSSKTMKLLIRVVAGAAVLFTSTTYAQHASHLGAGDWVGPIEIHAPEFQSEDNLIAIDIPYDGCSYDDEALVSPWMRTVTRAGNEISVYAFSPQTVCFSTGTVAEWSYHLTLGRLAAGSYSVTVHYRDQYEPIASPSFLSLQTTLEVVRGTGVASALPSLSTVSAGLLAAMLAFAGMFYARQRRANPR